MTRLLSELRRTLPDDCLTRTCNKDGCSLSLEQAPKQRVIVDLDAPSLGIEDQPHCDYLFVSDEPERVFMAPIEFKTGSFSSSHVVDQLRQGAELANRYLPPFKTCVLCRFSRIEGFERAI